MKLARHGHTPKINGHTRQIQHLPHRSQTIKLFQTLSTTDEQFTVHKGIAYFPDGPNI